MTNTRFYKTWLYSAEGLFIFQTVSMICASSERTLNDFIRAEYSWIGASPGMDEGWGASSNGGFFLRKVEHLIRLLQEQSWNGESEITGLHNRNKDA